MCVLNWAVKFEIILFYFTGLQMNLNDVLICLGWPFVSVRSPSCSASFWGGHQKACIKTKADSHSCHSKYAADNSCSPGNKQVSCAKHCTRHSQRLNLFDNT